MKKLVMGCAVAGLIALSAKSEAKLSGSVAQPRMSPEARPKSRKYLSTLLRMEGLRDEIGPRSGFADASLVPKEKNEIGVASWYGLEFQGHTTANGEVFDLNGLTAAHLTLPFGTIIRVTNLKNNKNILLRINDRGPYIARRMLDVSWAAAQRLGFVYAGTTPVRVEVVTYPRWFLSPSTAKTNY